MAERRLLSASAALLAVAAVAAIPGRTRSTAAFLIQPLDGTPPPPTPPYPPPLTEAQGLRAGAANNNGNLSIAEGTLLPHVTCIEYMALYHSESLPLFEAQMRALGLWDRVTVHLAVPDPDGKAAGCFRAHVTAWNAAVARGCESTLMVEEDVYFNEPVVRQSLAHADALVASGRAYDMLFLGYTPEQNISDGVLKSQIDPQRYMIGSVAPYDHGDYECVYRLHNWLCTQSYIISRPAMERWSNLTYVPGVTPPIDKYLSTQFDNNSFFAVRPAVGFQRYHAPAAGETGAEETGSANEIWKFVPGVFYSIYEPALFGKAGITSPSKCLAPAAAFSYTGLTTAVQRFKALGSNKDNASDPGVIEWAGPPTTWPSVDPDLTSLLGELKHYDGPTKLTAFPTL